MRFKRQRQLYKLKFEDPAMQGLEVTVRLLSVGALLDHQQREKEAKAGADGTDAVALSNLRIDQLTEQLVDWNLDDDAGVPVPATREGVATQDLEFIVDLINAANKAIYEVSVPLDESSTSGEPFPEASLPMEPLSESPSSSLMPVSS